MVNLPLGINYDTMEVVMRMNYDQNYIKCDYTVEELKAAFVKDFTRVRKENNLTQDLLSKYSKVSREKIARIEAKMHSPTVASLIDILGPIGYTIKIEKVKSKV